ncbi:MAG: hypothetical protein IPF99_29865 [Deltaproteobacteria bacterium]|nr:hypothetical protein [Deltaproteobacteria bacterium]
MSTSLTRGMPRRDTWTHWPWLSSRQRCTKRCGSGRMRPRRVLLQSRRMVTRGRLAVAYTPMTLPTLVASAGVPSRTTWAIGSWSPIMWKL